MNTIKTTLLKISIITVSYNSESTILDTIQSVNKQDYSNLEYVIVDGLSNDKTLDIINQNHKGVLLSEKDKGIYDAMNKGIDLATGDVIGILNSDDFYAENMVVSEVAKIFNQKDCDAVYADLLYVDEKDTKKVIRKWISGFYKKNSFLTGWMPPHPTLFLKKEVYNKFGKFNLQLKSAADYELMLRMLYKHNLKVEYLPMVTVHMRTGGQSNSSIKNRIKANKEDRLAWKINGLKPYWFTLYMKPLRKITQFIFTK